MVPGSLGWGSAVLAISATRAPSRAARTAIARPIPRLPPDMRMVRPESESMGSEPIPQERQHVLPELLEEATLVVTRGVEEELVEPELRVHADLLHRLLGIVRADEPARRLVEILARHALHHERVLDVLLLLGLEPKRRPEVGVRERALAAAVVRHLDLDHVADRAGVAPRLGGSLGHLPEQLLVQRGGLAAGANETVADPAGELRRERPGGGHVDRHRLVRPGVDRRPPGGVEAGLEVHALLPPQQPDQLDRLGQALAALLAPRELAAGDRRLVHRLPGPHPEEYAAGGEAAERGERLRHEERTALVTGGASGIGAATCRRLAAEGARVAVTDMNREGAETIADEIGGAAYELDVRSEESIAAAVAGMQERRRGRIVNTASEAGRVGSSGSAVYSAAKAGVIGFTKAIAIENGRYGITCNAVAPGPIDTPLLMAAPKMLGDLGKRIVETMVGSTNLRRLGQPDEVAAAIAFLASDDASYVTGQALGVSGGLARI